MKKSEKAAIRKIKVKEADENAFMGIGLAANQLLVRTLDVEWIPSYSTAEPFIHPGRAFMVQTAVSAHRISHKSAIVLFLLTKPTVSVI